MSMTPFIPTSTPFYMQQPHQQSSQMPQPSQPMWVPFPGSKRKADDTDNIMDDCGPAPPKQFAISEDAATYVLKDGYLIQPDNHTDSDWDETPLTSPVKQVQSSEDQMDGGHCQMNTLPPSWNKRAGVDENFDELNTGGKKLHESLRTSVESTHSIKTKVNDFKGSPKLYFFEGLTEVLSEKRNDDLALPRTLVSQTQKESSMALVVWKPKPGISSYLQQWDKSKANSPSPVDELIKKKSNDEKDVEMEMDTSP